MILLGLTGSVATVLAHKIVKALQTFDKDVYVIVTEKAKPFIDYPKLFQTGATLISEENEWEWRHNKFPNENVPNDKWIKNDPIQHIELKDRAKAFVIAPITANTIGKLANGICDNLLTTVARAWNRNRPMILAPAMNTAMWENPITIPQLNTIKNIYNATIVEPQSKMLACRTSGLGAMADIDKIVQTLKDQFVWSFPLEYCTGIPINPHPGAFGYSRRESKHTGVDLYTREYDFVCAVESGTVIGQEIFTGPNDNSPWWNETYCMLIEGKSGVVVYGEIVGGEFYDNRKDKLINLKAGDQVIEGQRIAQVARVIKKGHERPDITGHSPCMLHMELYPYGKTKASNGFEEYLQDPTPYLLNAKNKPSKILIYENYKPA